LILVSKAEEGIRLCVRWVVKTLEIMK